MSSDSTDALLRSVRRLLRPLVRLLLSHGQTLPTLVEIIKKAFVESAEQDFPLSDRDVSDSRISLLTGVHRKDVRRLRQSGEVNEDRHPRMSLGIQLVSTWLADPRYQTTRGAPRVLPRKTDTAGPSFDKLVLQVCRQDIRPRAMLDELLRLGIVELDARDRVRLVQNAYVPDAGMAEKAVYFGRNIGDHIAAGGHNLMGEKPRMPERGVHYSGLSREDIDELRRLANEGSDRLLRRINQRARQMQAENAGNDEAVHRMNFGVYFFTERSRQKAEAPDDDPDHAPDRD